MNLRHANKWWWFGVICIAIGLIANIAGRNMPAIGWGLAALAWAVVAEMMRQQYERQQEFVDELLSENARLITRLIQLTGPRP